MADNNHFTFEISLSVLNHLGRNLYRSFITVLGEAISNAWDADAENVWIYVDRGANNFIIKDDGIGMSDADFQNKFLKIGYSKRKDGVLTLEKRRPFIGRKGIGKLALLSCAEKITVISKIEHREYIGGVIDNTGLDDAINDDLTPDEYQLGEWQEEIFEQYIRGHNRGTIIYFETMKDGIRNTLDYLKKTIALYFRFSLLDNSFNIFVNDEKITLDHLNDLASKTEFAWTINDFRDPFVDEHLRSLKENAKNISTSGSIGGFIASVEEVKYIKIITTDERMSIDLFVNGRLREKDILKHIPTSRVSENYLYGQIHYNELDDDKDRFATSREGIISDDPKYKEFLENIRNSVIGTILSDWDRWRRKHREDGDSEDESIPKKERKSLELFNAVSEEYDLPKKSTNKGEVEVWVNELSDDAKYNFASYAECFISENLVRKFIQNKNVNLSREAEAEVATRQKNEKLFKGKGGISIEIRKTNIGLSYLSMDHLANLVDKRDPNKEACLARDANGYKPIRDALMHTALLSDDAKRKLTSLYDNIKGRVKTLLSGDNSST